MITAKYIGFLGSLYPSLLGILIVFSALIFIAFYVIVVSKVIGALEKNLLAKKGESVKQTAPVKKEVVKDNKDAIKVAIIAAAIAEDTHKPIDSFVITNIQKI